MATVNQAVVNSPLDAPAKARGRLMVRRRKVVNKVTQSFFPYICCLVVFVINFLSMYKMT